MEKQNRKSFWKSLLIIMLTVILLYTSVIFGNSRGIFNNSVRIAKAEGESVYAAYLSKGGNSAIYQLPDKQQSYVYFGSYLGEPVRWTILQRGTLNNSVGTMLYYADDVALPTCNYQFFDMSGADAYTYNVWSSSYIRAYLNGTPYATQSGQLTEWSDETLTDTLFGTSGKIRNMVCSTTNSTAIYADRYNTSFNANASHINQNHINSIENNANAHAYFDEIFEMTDDYLFPLSGNEITQTNGFMFCDTDGNVSPTQIVSTTSLQRNSIYFAHADGVRVNTLNLRNSVLKLSSSAARVVLDANGKFDSSTAQTAQFRVAMNVYNSDFQFVICGAPETGWVNGTVASASGNRPAYKAFIKGSSEIGSVSGMFPTSAYVLNGKLNIDLSKYDGNNYIDKYMLVVKDEAGNVVSSRGVDVGNYSGSSAIALDSSVLDDDLLKDGYTLETFGYKSTSGNNVSFCTQKAEVQVQNRRDVDLSLDNVSTLNELEGRIYGNTYSPITATALETANGNPATNYSYVIQYNDEDESGAWTTTVPTNVGRYAVRAYGAETEFYTEAVSPSALLVINKRTIQPVFTDTHNTGGNVGEKVYDGEPYNISVAFSNVVSGDVLTPVLSGTIGAISASDDAYELVVGGFTAEGTTLADNYLLGGDTTYTYYIRKKPITVIWGNLNHVYDGIRKNATATVAPTSPAPSQPLVISGGNMFGAGNYTVTAALSSEDSDNFTLSNPTAVLVIEKFLAIIQLGGTARSGEEATLTMNPTTPIPNGEHYYVIGRLSNNITLSTDWTPTSPISGTYRVWVMGHDESEYEISDLFFNYNIRILRGQLEILKTQITEIVWDENHYVYNAAVQTVSAIGKLADGTEIPLTVSLDREFKNAGEYIATATPVDSEQYEFAPSLSDTKNYTITKAAATIEWSGLTYKYDGTQKNPSVAWVSAGIVPSGEPTVEYEERINAGDYTVNAVYNGADKDNFEIVNPTDTLTIERVKVFVSLSVRASYGNEATFKALITTAMSDPIPADEMEYVKAQINSVEFETNWTPTSPTNQAYHAYLAGHNATVYLDYDLMPNYIVEWRRAIFYASKANVVSIEWSANDYTYNATEQTITAEGTTDFGGTITLEITVNKEFKNAANDYVATASISTADATNIQFGYGLATTKSYEIKKATATIVWSDLTFTYDGTQKDPTVAWAAAAVVPESTPVVVYAERINAGNYTVQAEYNGADKDNFVLSNDTETLVINQREVGILWTDVNGGTKTYDGTEYTVSATFTNLVSGDTLIPVITGDNGVNASETPYVKTITGFTAENGTVAGNYVLPSTGCDYNYTITKRNVSVSWANISFTYNAQAQKPTATWTDTVALNAGSELVVSGEQVNASDTPYTATVSVSGSDANNFTITNDTQTFTIGKKTVYVWWGTVNFTYDGTQKIPTASWNTGDVVPIWDLTIHYDEMVNVGEYTAYITYDGSDKDNFNLLSTTKIIRIHKASLRVELTGFANYGTEAVLSWSINENFSDRIPDAETDYVNDALNGVILETDWTPFSPMGQQYYVIYAGQNQSSYLDSDLMPNYMVDWRKSVFYPMKAEIASIDWSENDYTYNGTVQTITAIGKTSNNITVNLEIVVNKEFKNAANNYVATASISTADADNFEFEYGVITTKDYEIKRASAVLEWDNLTATYDGTQKTPTVAWVVAAVVPESAPAVVYAERINAGSYIVQAEYNGADKDNFAITGDSETLIIARSEITVSVLLTESGITFGDDMQAYVNAVWHTAADGGNNALLERLISGYSAGNNAGVYTITLDFNKAEDENRQSPETYLDNYNITEIISATLTVNKKAITATDIERWIADGDVSFNNKTVAEDGNVHMIYAVISGEAAEFIEVIAYKDKDGADFNGASPAGNYGITALISSVNGNYEAQDITLTARLRISIKTAIIAENGEIRGYIIGLDPDNDYTATLTENRTAEYSEQVGENGVEMVITITDENGNPVNDDELTYIIYPPNGYDADTGSMYIVNGGTLENLSGTSDGNGGIGFNAQTDNGVITLIASNVAEGLNINGWFFWLVIAGTTLCGFTVIVILIKKIRDEYAEK